MLSGAKVLVARAAAVVTLATRFFVCGLRMTMGGGFQNLEPCRDLTSTF